MTLEESDAHDARLLEAGDHRTLLARHYPRLRERAVLRMGPSDGDDVVQAAVLRLAEELGRGRRYRVPFRVAAHRVLDWTMRGHHRDGRERPVPEVLDEAPVDDEAPGVTIRVAIEQCIASLPRGDAEVMSLRFLHGMEIEEIAERLGRSRNAVDQALHRGRAALRTRWPSDG